MKQWVWLVILAVSLALFQPAPAHALSTLVFTAVPMDGGGAIGTRGRIYAGAEPVITMAGHEAQSVSDAVEVARRLNALAEAGIGPQELAIRKDRKTRTILGRGQPIVQIDRAQAKSQGTDQASLARKWLDNLAAQFGQPYLSADPVVVPVGEMRTTRVRGNIVGQVQVQADDPIVVVSYDTAGKAIRVTGQYTGSTEIAILDDRTALRVPVRSAKYAARVMARLTAGVTGNPASSEAVYRAAQAAVAAGLALEPGAWASINPRLKPAPSLPPGASKAVNVHVSAAGEEYLPYRAEPVVSVRNEPVPQTPADVLMVSNSPERLLSHGLWYEGSLAEIQSARLLYHHVNSSRVASDLIVELWNVGDQPARVQVISGKGGPSRDEAFAGHRAAAEFLVNRASNTGWIVPLPPKTAVPIIAQDMDPGSTLSGMLELRKLGPGDIRVRCYLEESRSAWLPYLIRSYQPSPVLGRWVYPQPRQEIGAKYVVGRDWAFVTIGDPPVPGTDPTDLLAGNYGVIYDITLDLVNPTAEPARVDVLMEPGGGAARALLLINGKPVEAAMLKQNSESRIARYILAPGEIRSVHIETTPQGGSNYPVRLFARVG